MSFIKHRVYEQKGWLATLTNPTPKRLSSVSTISIAPAQKRIRLTKPLPHYNPFEQYYETPLLSMARKEEEEEERNKILRMFQTGEITQTQQSNLVKLLSKISSTPAVKKIVAAIDNPVKTTVEILHDLDEIINDKQETAELRAALKAEEAKANEPAPELEKEKQLVGKTIRDTLKSWSGATTGLPIALSRRIRKTLSNLRASDDNVVDVSKDLQSWNDEENRSYEAQKLQGLLQSKKVSEEFAQKRQATQHLQGLLQSKKASDELAEKQQATQHLQGLLQSKKSSNELAQLRQATQNSQGLLRNIVPNREYEEYKRGLQIRKRNNKEAWEMINDLRRREDGSISYLAYRFLTPAYRAALYDPMFTRFHPLLRHIPLGPLEPIKTSTFRRRH